VIKGLPLTEAKAGELVLGIRKRKGLKMELPKVVDYVDKL